MLQMIWRTCQARGIKPTFNIDDQNGVKVRRGDEV